MFLEFLKLRSRVADSLVAHAENSLAKRRTRSELLGRQLALVEASAPTEVSVSDLAAKLEADGAATVLSIGGRSITLQQNGWASAGAPSAASGSLAAEVESAFETKVETLPVAETELEAAVNEAFGEVMFTAAEVEEMLRTRGAEPVTTMTVKAEHLPDLSETMTLARFKVYRAGETEVALTGTFISAVLFTGCENPACGNCGDAEDAAIVLHFVPDGKDRSIISTELNPDSEVRLTA